MELQRVLPGISTEQLRSRLNRMVADGMLTRKRYREVPPRVDYALTDQARKLMPVLGELARWGFEWAWSPPRETESVDVGAFFRLAPGLIPPNGSSGTVEFVVDEDADDEHCVYSCTVSSTVVTVEQSKTHGADARVSGTHSEWVRALCPEGELGALEITGNRALAEKLLRQIGAFPAGGDEPRTTRDSEPRTTGGGASRRTVAA